MNIKKLAVPGVVFSIGLILAGLVGISNQAVQITRELILTPGGGCGCPYEHCGCLQITLPPYTPPNFKTPYSTVSIPIFGATASPVATITSAPSATRVATWTPEPTMTVKYPDTPTARPTLTRMPTMTTRPTWTPASQPTSSLPPTWTPLATYTPNPQTPQVPDTPSPPPTPTQTTTPTQVP